MASYAVVLLVLFALMAAASDGVWWSTPWIEFIAASVSVLLAIGQLIVRPRWVAVTPILLAIFLVAVGMFMWPYYTACRFIRLVQEGRFEEANGFMQHTPWDFQDDVLLVQTVNGPFRVPKHGLPLESRDINWDCFVKHGTFNWFGFHLNSQGNKWCWVSLLASRGWVVPVSYSLYDKGRPMSSMDWDEFVHGTDPAAAKLPENVVPMGLDENRLQGTWVSVAGDIIGGQPLPADQLKAMTLVFTGNKARVTKPGGESMEGPFTLDPDKNPKRIHIEEETPNRVFSMNGIYSLEGDTLKVCIGAPEDPRPTQFVSKAGTKILNLFLKKAGQTTGKLPETADKRSDHEKLQGSWLGEFIEQGGKKIVLKDSSAKFALTFKGDVMSLKRIFFGPKAPEGIIGRELEGVFRLDTAEDPKRIDVNPVKDISVFGIYRLEGDQLTICYYPQPKLVEYPSAFATQKGSPVTLMQFKRAPGP